MNRTKVIISASLFLILTMVKLAFPALATDMRGYILPVLSESTDYREAMVTLGERITGEEGVVASLGRLYNTMVSGRGTGDAWKPTETPPVTATPPVTEEPPPATENIEETAPPPSEEPVESAEPEPSPTPDANPEAIVTAPPLPVETPEVQATPPGGAAEWVLPGAVTTFLATQEKFSDEQIPANVSYMMPELPFEYAGPVGGFSSSGFGFREHPIDGGVKFHYGTDVGAYSGTDIYAFADGTVLTAGENDSYGLYVVISHAGGYKTLYAHCSLLYAESGQTVKKGDKIALVGQTGQATGPHLHFELIGDSIYYNPEYYI